MLQCYRTKHGKKAKKKNRAVVLIGIGAVSDYRLRNHQCFCILIVTLLNRRILQLKEKIISEIVVDKCLSGYKALVKN